MDDHFDLQAWLHENCRDIRSEDFLSALPEFNAEYLTEAQTFRQFVEECDQHYVWWLPLNEMRDGNVLIMAFNYKGVYCSCKCAEAFDEPAGYFAAGPWDSP